LIAGWGEGNSLNIVPRLIDNPTWATIAGFSANELVELAMFVLLSTGLVVAVAYGIYRAMRHRGQED
jgi:hypothetical protein